MDFGQAISSCFRKYVTFRGRAPRSEYWFFVLFMFLVFLGTSVLDAAFVGANPTNPARPFTGLAWLAMFLPGLAVTFRRLHDTGWSGWLVGGFYLLSFIIGIFAAAYGDRPDNMPMDPPEIAASLVALGWLAYGIFLFVLTVLKGHDGSNRYGPDPFGTDADVF